MCYLYRGTRLAAFSTVTPKKSQIFNENLSVLRILKIQNNGFGLTTNNHETINGNFPETALRYATRRKLEKKEFIYHGGLYIPGSK